MDLEWRVAELERLVQEQGRKIAALEVEAQKRHEDLNFRTQITVTECDPIMGFQDILECKTPNELIKKVVSILDDSVTEVQIIKQLKIPSGPCKRVEAYRAPKKFSLTQSEVSGGKTP